MFLLNEVKKDKMLRRKPTRLELKIDDTEEFESVKKELEVSGVQKIRAFSWYLKAGWPVMLISRCCFFSFSRVQQFNNDKKIRNNIAKHRKNIWKKCALSPLLIIYFAYLFTLSTS